MSNEEYITKGITTNIKATSRIALKIRDNFYTIEYTEERTVPDVEDIDLDEERKALFDTVNNIVDDQIEDIYNNLKK